MGDKTNVVRQLQRSFTIRVVHNVFETNHHLSFIKNEYSHVFIIVPIMDEEGEKEAEIFKNSLLKSEIPKKFIIHAC